MAKLREFLETLPEGTYTDQTLRDLAETSLDSKNKKANVDAVVSHDLRKIQKAVEDEARDDGADVRGRALRVVM